MRKTLLFSILFTIGTITVNASQTDREAYSAMMQEKYGAGANEKKYQQQDQYRNGSGEGRGQGKQMRKRDGSGGGNGKHGKR